MRDRSLRGQLQRTLGDLGTVLPHQKRGTPDRIGRGWYAELSDGRVVFLGDHLLVATIEISKLLEVSRTPSRRVKASAPKTPA
jgi:hypothetical protein